MGMNWEIVWRKMECDYCEKKLFFSEQAQGSLDTVCGQAITYGWWVGGNLGADGSPYYVVCGEDKCMRRFAKDVIARTRGCSRG